MDTEYKTPSDVVDGIGERVFNSTSPGGGWADDDLGAAFEFGISDPPPPTSNYKPGPQPPKPKNLNPLWVLVIIPVAAIAALLFFIWKKDRDRKAETQRGGVDPVVELAGREQSQQRLKPPGETVERESEKLPRTASKPGVVTAAPGI